MLSLSVEVPSQDEKTTPKGTSLAISSPVVLTSESPTICTTRHSVPLSEDLESVQKRPQLDTDTKPESEGLEPLHKKPRLDIDTIPNYGTTSPPPSEFFEPVRKKPRLDADAEHNGCITSLASSESFEKKLPLNVCTEQSWCRVK